MVEVRVRRDEGREGRGVRLRLHRVRAGRQGEPHHGHGNKQGRTNRYVHISVSPITRCISLPWLINITFRADGIVAKATGQVGCQFKSVCVCV